MKLYPPLQMLALLFLSSWVLAQNNARGKLREAHVGALAGCHCKCVLQRLDAQACKSKAYLANGSYAMDAWTSGPHCQCDCHLGRSMASFCDRMWKAEKMLNSVPDITKITTLADRLTGAVQSLDLRKLNSNLHRIQSHMKSLEQGLKVGHGLETQLLKKSLASLHRNADVLHGYSDTIKALTKEVFKLNLLLKQGGLHGPEMANQSISKVKNHQMGDGGSHATRIAVASHTTPEPGGKSMAPTSATVRAEENPIPALSGRGENMSSINVTASAHEEKEQTEQPNNVREGECSGTLQAIDSPVTCGSYGKLFGAWMKDALSQEDKIYITENLFGSSLLEFRNLEHLQQGRPSQSYALPCSWIGAGHLVYNGSFYFNEAFTRTIQRYDLRQRSVAAWSSLDDLVTQPTVPLVWRGYSDVTFSADQGGLWVIYPSNHFGYRHEESIVVAMLDSEDLLIRKETSWRTGLQSGSFGVYFLICGVLYSVNGQTAEDKLISYAFDTHTATETLPGLVFPGEVSLLTHLTHDTVAKRLYGWFNGTLLTYSLHLTF